MDPLSKINAFYTKHGRHANDEELVKMGIAIVSIDDAFRGVNVDKDTHVKVCQFIHAKSMGQSASLATVIGSDGRLGVPIYSKLVTNM